jgi:hypothetical protein
MHKKITKPPAHKPWWHDREEYARQRRKARERVKYHWYFYPYMWKGYYVTKEGNIYAVIQRYGIKASQRCATKREARMKYLEWTSRLRAGEDIRIIRQEAEATKVAPRRNIKGSPFVDGVDPPQPDQERVVGVSWQRTRRCWQSQYVANGVAHYKYFTYRADAVAQRRKWEQQYGVPMNASANVVRTGAERKLTTRTTPDGSQVLPIGVCYDKRRGTYLAHIKVPGGKQIMKHFKSVDAAIAQRRAWEIQMIG